VIRRGMMRVQDYQLQVLNDELHVDFVLVKKIHCMQNVLQNLGMELVNVCDYVLLNDGEDLKLDCDLEWNYYNHLKVYQLIKEDYFLDFVHGLVEHVVVVAVVVVAAVVVVVVDVAVVDADVVVGVVSVVSVESGREALLHRGKLIQGSIESPALVLLGIFALEDLDLHYILEHLP
jgi:hypothetical protein